MITLTTNEMAKYEPCDEFYTKYLPALGKDKPDDEPFTFSQLAKFAPIGDIIWCLRCLDDKHIDKMREFARRCTDRVAYFSDYNLTLFLYAKRAMESVNAADAADAVYDVAEAVSWSVHYAAEAAADDVADFSIADFVWTNNIMVAIASASRDARKKEQAKQLKILLEIMGRDE